MEMKSKLCKTDIYCKYVDDLNHLQDRRVSNTRSFTFLISLLVISLGFVLDRDNNPERLFALATIIGLFGAFLSAFWWLSLRHYLILETVKLEALRKLEEGEDVQLFTQELKNLPIAEIRMSFRAFRCFKDPKDLRANAGNPPNQYRLITKYEIGIALTLIIICLIPAAVMFFR